MDKKGIMPNHNGVPDNRTLGIAIMDENTQDLKLKIEGRCIAELKKHIQDLDEVILKQDDEQYQAVQAERDRIVAIVEHEQHTEALALAAASQTHSTVFDILKEISVQIKVTPAPSHILTDEQADDHTSEIKHFPDMYREDGRKEVRVIIAEAIEQATEAIYAKCMEHETEHYKFAEIAVQKERKRVIDELINRISTFEGFSRETMMQPEEHCRYATLRQILDWLKQSTAAPAEMTVNVCMRQG